MVNITPTWLTEGTNTDIDERVAEFVKPLEDFIENHHPGSVLGVRLHIMALAMTKVGEFQDKNAALRRQRDDLLAANNVYLERARTAEQALTSVGHLPTANPSDLADHEPNPPPDRVEWKDYWLGFNGRHIGGIQAGGGGSYFHALLMGERIGTRYSSENEAKFDLETAARQWLNLPIPHKEG